MTSNKCYVISFTTAVTASFKTMKQLKNIFISNVIYCHLAANFESYYVMLSYISSLLRYALVLKNKENQMGLLQK